MALFSVDAVAFQDNQADRSSDGYNGRHKTTLGNLLEDLIRLDYDAADAYPAAIASIALIHSCYTGESRCLRQPWVPAFAGKARGAELNQLNGSEH
jgi:hypothetical protein